MTLRGWSLLVAALVLASAGGAPARADEALAETLRSVVERNADAHDRKDVAAMLETIDSRSPAYEASRAVLEELDESVELDAEVVDFRFIGRDDEFAVARVKTRTVATAGDDRFADHVEDSILLFHQENGAWKLWSEHVLGVVASE